MFACPLSLTVVINATGVPKYRICGSIDLKLVSLFIDYVVFLLA